MDDDVKVGATNRFRPIKRILVANRGEIAIRILQACRELSNRPFTLAIYSDTDNTHIALGRPDQAIKIPSAESYMDVGYLITLAKQHKIDAIHPGYGFLSESAEFSRRMWDEAGVNVIGPGADVLSRTGDKLKAKALATEWGVPILKAMSQPTSSVADVARFVKEVGLLVMIKAVDGGGGRGIRLVQSHDELENAVQRCINESPSRSVFAESAAVVGFKHIEIQIIGDGKGGVRHVWERDCSIQRRFQKIVEVAPSPVSERGVIAHVIDSAVRMARRLNYLGLGTWEFLVNIEKNQFFFLEINPRLQVEHTITECIADLDLVKEQLMLAQGLISTTDIVGTGSAGAESPPSSFSIQFRLCAEDPENNFALSIGKITDMQFPRGNGVRVDSHLHSGGVVGSSFDNLMAKIIITARSWNECVAKAQRALSDTRIVGVKTNLDLLRAIAADAEFQSGKADTKWLENNMEPLIRSGRNIGRQIEETSSRLPALPLFSASTAPLAGLGPATFHKGDAWSLTLQPLESDKGASHNAAASHLAIDKISRNNFPEAFSAEISFTTSGQKSVPYKLTLESTTASSSTAGSTHRRGDPNNRNHITIPMSGKLVEVLVEEGDTIAVDQVIGFIKQMKMEIEIRSPRAGTVTWAIELEDENGDDVAEGVLLVELADGRDSKL